MRRPVPRRWSTEDLARHNLDLMRKFEAQLENGTKCRIAAPTGRFKKTTFWLEHDHLYWNPSSGFLPGKSKTHRSQTQALALQDISSVNGSVDACSCSGLGTMARLESCFELLTRSSGEQNVIFEMDNELAKNAFVEGFELLLGKFSSDLHWEKASGEQEQSGSARHTRRPKWGCTLDCSDLVKNDTSQSYHGKSIEASIPVELLLGKFSNDLHWEQASEEQDQPGSVDYISSEEDGGEDKEEKVADCFAKDLTQRFEAQLENGFTCRTAAPAGRFKKTMFWLENDILYWNPSSRFLPGKSTFLPGKSTTHRSQTQALALQDISSVNGSVDAGSRSGLGTMARLESCFELLTRSSGEQNVIIEMGNELAKNAFVEGFELLLGKLSNDLNWEKASKEQDQPGSADYISREEDEGEDKEEKVVDCFAKWWSEEDVARHNHDFVRKFVAQLNSGTKCRTAAPGGRFKKTTLWLEEMHLYWNPSSGFLPGKSKTHRSQTQALALQDISSVNGSVDAGSCSGLSTTARLESCFELLTRSSGEQNVIIEMDNELAKNAFVEGFELLLEDIFRDEDEGEDEEEKVVDYFDDSMNFIQDLTCGFVVEKYSYSATGSMKVRLFCDAGAEREELKWESISNTSLGKRAGGSVKLSRVREVRYGCDPDPECPPYAATPTLRRRCTPNHAWKTLAVLWPEGSLDLKFNSTRECLEVLYNLRHLVQDAQGKLLLSCSGQENAGKHTGGGCESCSQGGAKMEYPIDCSDRVKNDTTQKDDNGKGTRATNLIIRSDKQNQKARPQEETQVSQVREEEVMEGLMASMRKPLKVKVHIDAKPRSANLVIEGESLVWVGRNKLVKCCAAKTGTDTDKHSFPFRDIAGLHAFTWKGTFRDKTNEECCLVIEAQDEKKNLELLNLEFKHKLERDAYTEGIGRLMQRAAQKQQAGGTGMRKFPLFSAEPGRATFPAEIEQKQIVLW